MEDIYVVAAACSYQTHLYMLFIVHSLSARPHSAVISARRCKIHTVRGIAHRDDDRSAITVRYDSSIRRKLWYRNGRKHRDGDQPAAVCFDDDRVYRVTHYRHGKKHRDNDRPAQICTSGAGPHVAWWVDGYKGRQGDKPTFMGYNRMDWRRNSRKHRDHDKPAYIYLGATTSVEWFTHGSQRRDNGPMTIYIDEFDGLPQLVYSRASRRTTWGDRLSNLLHN